MWFELLNWVSPLDYFSVPLLNTAVLLSSGANVTWAHHAIISGRREEAILDLSLTVLFGALFTGLQAIEYYEAPFAISDLVYGSTFFMATGFHGFHVIIGTTFLTVCLIRLKSNNFTCRRRRVGIGILWMWCDCFYIFVFIGGAHIVGYYMLNGLFYIVNVCGKKDIPEPWHLGLQEVADPVMEEIVFFHDQIMFLLIVVVMVVL